MKNDNFDNLMMSDSIKGQILDFDDNDAVKKLEDSFLVTALEVKFDGNIEPLVGSTVGLSFDTNECVNIDLRVNTAVAYELLRKYNISTVECMAFYMSLGQEEICNVGPYKFVSLKMLDFDHQNKMCTLGIDMVKI